MIQVKRLFEDEKTQPAKNILESMVNHLEAVRNRENTEKLRISKEKIENLMKIINKVNLNI